MWLLALWTACSTLSAPDPTPPAAPEAPAAPPAGPPPTEVDATVVRVAWTGADGPPPRAPRGPEDARAEAARLAQALREGADPAQTATAASDDATAPRGGRLGLTPAVRLDPALADAIGRVAPGQVFGPVRTPTGWWTGVRRAPEVARVTWAQVGFDGAHRATSRRSRDQARAVAVAATDALRAGLPPSEADAQGVDRVGPGQWPPALFDALRRLAPGEVSEPILTPQGWLVLRREPDGGA
jgi:peptidyl-prolyl cis-trans isomerase SurA